MKLLNRYASECGLDITNQYLLEQFYPLSQDKYITIHPSSGMAAKNYPYYQEVIVMVKPYIDKLGISIVQLGDKDDQSLQECVNLQGKTSIHQSNYILGRSLLHIGNDSWLCHRVGELGIPLITLFGSTRSSNHGAYKSNPTKTVFLESHRWGRNPTFSAQENPQSIALIPPETVANAVLSLLDLPHRFTHQTRLIGMLYTHVLFDIVPNSFPAPTFLPEAPMTVRMDILHREDVLANLLATGRKANILTKKPIDLNLLARFKGSILSYTHEIDDQCPIQYAGMLGGVIRNSSFFTKEKDDDKVAALRFRFFDICIIQRASDVTRDDYLNGAMGYLNWKGDEAKAKLDAELKAGTVAFKSNHYYLSDGRVFLSLAHLNQNLSTPDFAANQAPVIDHADWYRDVNHMIVFNQPVSTP
jgi:hypothetical protein